ncbi:hydrolase [Salinisphaera japonica]|uniref:Alpha/beta hydrolase n=1 Tax=Salinisphaera japonica YTM-1 TaxID=1209778 RepID=A0A423Q0G9_9GAMM|nr:hydrolase [Salinisphaera japonica]ROO31419.1 alpha/beta hydrolase [Salinisphaera japonica YTM-1]
MLTTSAFKPAFWLANPHAQTVFAAKARPMPRLSPRAERLELADGDFLDLSWIERADTPAEAPVVIVLHGLTGSLDSKYARGLLARIDAHGGRGVLLHFRGSAVPNRLPRAYHSGETRDLAYVIDHVRRTYPGAPLAGVGYSLGGNVLLKYLGEQGERSPLACATAVSVPYDLAACGQAIKQGLSRFYQAHLLAGMRAVVRAKQAAGVYAGGVVLPELDGLTDFASFDDAVTAPLNGFVDAADYYARSSSRGFLGAIRTPTLMLHARDDPFMSPSVVPGEDELSDALRLEVSAGGGHVGFVAGDRLGRPVYWLEQRIPAYLRAYLPGFEPRVAASVVPTP